jgi:hypothetical protein
MGRDAERQRIARQVEDFLSGGGQIEVVESKSVCPTHMKWAERRGMDWSSWDQIGGSDWCSRGGDFKLDLEDFEED